MAAAAVPHTAATGAGGWVLDGKLGPARPEAEEAAGQTLLFAGAAATLGRSALDEELHIRGSSVAWAAGGVLRKQLGAAGAVLRAAWCFFQNTGPEPILCLLHHGALSVHTQGGDWHAIPLPGAFTALWPLPQGVLLTGAPEQGPCILVHPLENIQEVQMLGGGAAGAAGGSATPGAAGGGAAGGGWGEDERVVWSGVEVPYLVTHSARTQRLAVWSISRVEEAPGFVAVTPVRWPAGGPRTPAGTLAPVSPVLPGLLPPQGTAGLHTGGLAQMLATPPAAGRAGGGGAATYKKASLRLPNGCLSPMAFNPAPRSATTPAPGGSTAGGAAAPGAAAGPLLLPSQEVPITFSLLWEQQVDTGADSSEQLEGHLASDANGDLLLCLQSRSAQRLTALRLPPPGTAAAAPLAAARRIEVAFTLPALAVAAVEAALHTHRAGEHQQGGQAPPPRDLLVLHPDGRLSLHVGWRRLCTVALPGDSTAGTAGTAAYAQLLGHGHDGHGGAGGQDGGEGKARLAANASQLSASRHAPSAAAEVQSGLGGDSDGEAEGDGMLVSPGRASSGHQQAAAPAPPDALPDVRSLADALEAPPAVVDLQNAVGNRVTLRLAGGGRLRVALPFAPTAPLAKAGLEALQAALPGETWWALYACWLAAPGSTSGDAEEQWQALAQVVLAWAADPAALRLPQEAAPRPHLPRPSGASSGTTATTTATPQRQLSATTAAPPSGPAAWQQLLGSEHHRRHGGRFAWAAQARAPSQEQVAAAAAAGGRQEALLALQALHAVYEDCKMSVLRWRLLPTLGRDLLRLAGLLEAAAYADHYCRDLGLAAGAGAALTAAGTGGADSAAATATPPDMFRALQQLLGGQREGRGAAPLLAQQRAPCVQRSTDLLDAYVLLVEAADSMASHGGSAALELAQAADLLEAVSPRLVRLLVRQRWTLADLDALPFGVALPLRQCIQHCRSSPPNDWPEEAYVLIGRNDIAASMAAAEQEEQPVEATISSIVSTPLGKMAKTTSPKKPPRQQAPPGGAPVGAGHAAGSLGAGLSGVGTPAGATPTPGMLRRLSALNVAATPPLASAMRHPQGGLRQPGGGGGGSLLAAPEGETSRVVAAPELLPVPYTHRLQLPAPVPAASGEGGEEGGSERQATVVAASSGAVTSAGDPEAGDGMENLAQEAARLRFGRDLRLLEVRRLLRSSAPVPLRMGNVPEPSDAEGTAAQQLKLTALAIRTCALPLGRGALTLGTLRPLPTEPLHIPPLCLAGRLPEQNNAVVNLDFTGAAPAPGGGAFAEQTAWPEFHNGVAAGLRLAPGTHQLTRTWVVYNKPAEPSYTHAGMLMALGLTGHLSCLTATDLYRYLAQEHDATIIGVLLGMAASKRGSQDATISKTLFLHLPTRHPSSYPELDVSPLVQAAALAGVGLLFQGTSHRVMAEVMLEEIGRRPGAASKEEEEGGQPGAGGLHKGVTRDREGYALAAGLALGLITLGKGRSAVGLADLQLEEKLRYFMVGGAPSGTVGTHQGLSAAGGQAPLPGDGVFGPGVIGFDPTLGEPEPRHGPLPRASGSTRVVGSVAEELAAAQGSSQVVLEGELLNLGVTSPAAVLALGLMYLQTNDAALAAAFQLPDTHFALDFVQPEHLTLRTLMRSLVMWDSIQPSEEWLLVQLPPLLKGPLPKFMAGEGGGVPGADYEALTQAHCAVLAGACLAVGIRFAGSCNARAEELLRKYCSYFMAAKQRAPEPGAGQPCLTNKHLLEEALGCVLLALSVVMAGSGHLPTFKLLRALRKRLAPATLSNATQPSAAAPPTTSLNYGAHCTVSTAMGFLFMGAGTLTFGTSPEAVAALVISLFPRMPASTMDHRCHLQAFRHLYVLAAQPLSVDAIDVDTKQAVYVPLDISLHDPAAPTPTAAAAGRLTSVLRPVTSISKGAGDVLADFAAQSGLPSNREHEGHAEGGTAAAGGVRAGAGSVTFERYAPCLLPEQEQAAEVRVKGPRYWQQQLVAAGLGGRGGRHSPSLATLYATRTLFVQRKAGALPYADDPSGVRSVLSRMAHHQGGGSGTDGNESFELVHLCATFGSDPFVMSFAQLFCAGGDDPGGFQSRLPVAAASFRNFCRGALYECITCEKPAALPTYLLLHCIKQALPQGGVAGAAALARLWGGLPPAVPLRSLSLALAYHDSRLGLAGEQARAAALRSKGGGLSRRATAAVEFFSWAGVESWQGGACWAVMFTHGSGTLIAFCSSLRLIPRAHAGGEAAAQQWEPVINPLLLQATWQALEATWTAGSATGAEALRRYVATGALADSPAAADGGVGAVAADAAAAAGKLGAYLQLHGVPAPGALQAVAGEVQDMLRSAGLPNAGSAAAAAAAMLARRQPGLSLPAAQALAAALLH
ncbi:hypothetical protein ABPG75_011687 [Micractinium tetrahymenae]